MNSYFTKKLTALSLILIAFFVFSCVGCKGCSDDLDDANLVVADRQRKGGTDITFIVAADTHFGFKDLEAVNKRQILSMNFMPDRAYPPKIGDKVARPRGVLIVGDLTDNGRSNEWRQFVKYYGLTGKDGLLKYPVFECTGNHDRYPALNEPVLDGVKKRHGGLTYSWDWDDVHLVCLDEYPDKENLRWLRRDLAKAGRKLPIVIYFHFSISGPYSGSWSDREKEAFRKAIDGFNIIGIFHGHYHRSGRYRWEGYDVYNVGSPKHMWHSFAVVRITDTKMTVASWEWESGTWGWSHSKRINQRK